tara:strand:+ start:1642 stop:2250 length:609 start_codon:yes stop_codon:yes gene_type:complete
MGAFLESQDFQPSEPIPQLDEATLRYHKLDHSTSQDALDKMLGKAYVDFKMPGNIEGINPQGANLYSGVQTDFLKFDKAMLYSGRHFRGGGPGLAESMGIEVHEPEQVRCTGYVCVYVNVGYLSPQEASYEIQRHMDTYCVNLRNVPEDYKVLWLPVRPPQESKIELVSFDKLDRRKSWVTKSLTNIMKRLKGVIKPKRKKT